MRCPLLGRGGGPSRSSCRASGSAACGSRSGTALLTRHDGILKGRNYNDNSVRNAQLGRGDATIRKSGGDCGRKNIDAESEISFAVIGFLD